LEAVLDEVDILDVFLQIRGSVKVSGIVHGERFRRRHQLESNEVYSRGSWSEPRDCSPSQGVFKVMMELRIKTSNNREEVFVDFPFPAFQPMFIVLCIKDHPPLEDSPRGSCTQRHPHHLPHWVFQMGF